MDTKPAHEETSSLKRENHGAVEFLTLNRAAKLNALNGELLNALMRALDEVELNSAVRVVVITGAGRAFSAGADIAGFRRYLEAGPQEAVVHFMRPGHQLTRRIESFAKPIIAAVNGLAFGGGCELVESTHIALAADTATFSKAEINIGIIPTFGGTQRLPRNVGRKAAIELILTGRTFDAAEAVMLGLVNRVVPSAKLLDESLALANLLASKPPLTLASALGAIHRGMDAAIDDGLAIEEAAFAPLVRTHDAREGVQAFLEKRPPRFLGR
jgi:enoyl-CoA hydratase/carnithine racemase